LTGIGGEPAGMIDYRNNRYGICTIVQSVIMPNHLHLILTIGGSEPGRANGTGLPVPFVFGYFRA
jgi:hypothetical protein